MTNETSIAQVLALYDERAPLSEASTIPAPWYVDPRIAEFEARTVFSKTWQVIGRTDQVDQPGDFVPPTILVLSSQAGWFRERVAGPETAVRIGSHRVTADGLDCG